MASKYTEGLKIEGGTIKEIDLRSESAKDKLRRLRLKKKLAELGLGDSSRDKKRFMKED
jgi:hypothetical protein